MPNKLMLPVKAEWAKEPPEFPNALPPTAAMQAGINYEKAVLKKLEKIYRNVKASPWILYKSITRNGICQPDGLIFLAADHVVLVEIKLSHVRAAREKLMHFYRPLIEYLYPGTTVTCLQIYKNSRRGAHKKPHSIYSLDASLKKGTYNECCFPG
jgi:hypothetical protein